MFIMEYIQNVLAQLDRTEYLKDYPTFSMQLKMEKHFSLLFIFPIFYHYITCIINRVFIGILTFIKSLGI